ncbi:MAG: DUF5717 family protein [Defluviitaleaceae bacterium]|nr:DUF5717 family protein [Defluviitaleaceae bacterium]
MNKNLIHLEQHPPPKLVLSEAMVSLRGSGLMYGSFEVRNGAGGELSGFIAPMADFISFSPISFEGNRVTVEYTVDLTGLTGDIQTGAIITTNGGERVLDFYITANRPDVIERDGVVMSDMADFADFARAHPVPARTLFGRHDFMVWLLNISYSNMDMYENFMNDPNKERAVDNFLIFNDCKSKARVMPAHGSYSHLVGLWDDVVTGSIILRKSTWGYAAASLEVTKGADWLKLSKDKIASSDFDGQNMAGVHYMVMANQLKGREIGEVTLNGEHKISIHASPAPAFEARLSKGSLFFEDTGKLIVTNNTGRDIFIDIDCEPFVRFDAKRYLVSQTAEIDFTVKYSNFKTSSLSFKRQMYAQTFIHVVAINEGTSFGKRLPLTLWSN